jgi:hypothetical protein
MCGPAKTRPQQSLLLTFVLPGVFDKVVLQNAHQDGGEEASEQQHGDTGVDDGEPVDLASKGNKRQLCVY